MNECPWVYDTRLMWQSLEIAMRGGIAWISGHHGHHHWKVKIWLSKKQGQDTAELSNFSSSLAGIEQTTLPAIPWRCSTKSWQWCTSHEEPWLPTCTFAGSRSITAIRAIFNKWRVVLHALRTRQLLLNYRINGQRIYVRIAMVQIL